MLESLPQWSWNPFEDKWNEGFEYLKKYVEEHEHARVPKRLKYANYSLGQWISEQRKIKANNNLDLEKIKLLEALPQWSWDVLGDQWNEGFEYLKKYVEEYGHAKVPNGFKYEDFNLGAWVSSTKTEKR